MKNLKDCSREELVQILQEVQMALWLEDTDMTRSKCGTAEVEIVVGGR